MVSDQSGCGLSPSREEVGSGVMPIAAVSTLGDRRGGAGESCSFLLCSSHLSLYFIRFRLGTGRMPQVKGQALHVRMRNRGDNTWFTCVRWCTRTDSAADCTAVSYYGVSSHSQAI